MLIVVVVAVLAGAVTDAVVVAGVMVVAGVIIDEGWVVDVICLVVDLRFLCGLGGSVRESVFEGLVCCVVFRVQVGLRDIKEGIVFCGGFC